MILAKTKNKETSTETIIYKSK